VDEVTIQLPAGYAFENAESPAPYSAGTISEYRPSLRVSKDGHTLVYKREFFFGGGETLLFPVNAYRQLKNFFDALHKEDNHTITLKQNSATAASN
jgi:hypothetical protein